jgi:hypothetical protein
MEKDYYIVKGDCYIKYIKYNGDKENSQKIKEGRVEAQRENAQGRETTRE